MNITQKRINYILIDYENVQPTFLKFPDDYIFKVIIFVGSNQKKLPIEFVNSVQELGTNAEYILIGGTGKNALDFHLTYYLGKLTEKNPNGYFHIITKDTGFDLLIKYLKEKKMLINRHCDINDIPALKQISNESLPIEQKIELIVSHLKKRGNSKPRKEETLSNAINSLFARKLSEKQLDAIIKLMSDKSLIVIQNNKLTYKLK